jgi:hypothetical protein
VGIHRCARGVEAAQDIRKLDAAADLDALDDEVHGIGGVGIRCRGDGNRDSRESDEVSADGNRPDGFYCTDPAALGAEPADDTTGYLDAANIGGADATGIVPGAARDVAADR